MSKFLFRVPMAMNTRMAVRNNSIQALYKCGYTRKELAAITGLSPSRIGQILNNPLAVTPQP